MLESKINRNYRSGSRKGVASRIKSVAGSTLDKVIETGKHAVSAANPIRDVKNTYTAIKNIVSEKPSWTKYKENLKKGKFLGEGNLSTLLFNTGMVATGMYVPLLMTRATIGAGSYVGKEALGHEKVRGKVASLVDICGHVPAVAGKAIGVPYKETRKALKKDTIEGYLKKAKEDDKFFKEKVFPLALDGAIGLKGYAGLVGAKYGTKVASKLSESIRDKARWSSTKYVADKAAKVTGFMSNFFSDALSALVFKHGCQYSANEVKSLVAGEYNDDVRNGVNYVKSGEITKDVKDYFNSGRATDDLKNMANVVTLTATAEASALGVTVADAAKGIWTYTSSGELVRDVKDGVSYVKDGKIVDDAKATANNAADYVTSGEILRDGGEAVADVAARTAKNVAGDLGDLTGINPSEKHAVIVAGFDYDYGGIFGTPNPNWFLCEVNRAYNDFLDMGFEPENIKVLSPNGLDRAGMYLQGMDGYDNLKDAFADSSYDHEASKANLAEVLEKAGREVDGNDTFMFYLASHGEQTWDSPRQSYFNLSNGGERCTVSDLKDMEKGINAGREFYVIGSCHSGGFVGMADEEHEEAICSTSQDTVAWGRTDGQSFIRYFVDEMKKEGFNRNITDAQIKDCMARAMDRHKYGQPLYHDINNQVAQWGNGGSDHIQVA